MRTLPPRTRRSTCCCRRTLDSNDSDIDSSSLNRGDCHGPKSRLADAQRRWLVRVHAGRKLQRSDSFSYQVNDETAISNVATVTLSVTAVNDAPIAVDDA